MADGVHLRPVVPFDPERQAYIRRVSLYRYEIEAFRGFEKKDVTHIFRLVCFRLARQGDEGVVSAGLIPYISMSWHFDKWRAPGFDIHIRAT